MDITTQTDGGMATLKVVGRVDAIAMSKLEQAAGAAIEAGASRLVIDMRQVDYISSAGLRAVLMAAKKAQAVGGGIALFGLQPAVEDVMTTSGFATIVRITATEDEARALLSA
ncbi:MAG: STAS domain-containing protein [Acetobacteraceae bacterium]|nr:STAS domain-containing protein [Pseudomonadota bacterium]